MSKEFTQIDWNDDVIDDCRQLIRLAVREDLDRFQDWTTLSLIPAGKEGAAHVVARENGTIAGLHAGALVVEEMELSVNWKAELDDGDTIAAGQLAARLSGSLRDLLTAERLILNLMGRLSGIATQTRRYVDAAAGHTARVFDTRKTTPGWRRLEKYAVRCGGGWNHRTGLFDAILIKDNHLASFREDQPEAHRTSADAVREARQMAREAAQSELALSKAFLSSGGEMIVEIEVDTLDQLDEVLPSAPDIVLLDNMSLKELTRAVARRDATAPAVQLEASGSIRLETIADVAATGVDRISVGALTHSAPCLDIGLDWPS